jgi:hypothetical protein
MVGGMGPVIFVAERSINRRDDWSEALEVRLVRGLERDWSFTTRFCKDVCARLDGRSAPIWVLCTSVRVVIPVRNEKISSENDVMAVDSK